MIIDCIGCLHGHMPALEGGDLLIVTGDLTAMNTPLQHFYFIEWLKDQPYKKKIVIAGNHDGFIEKLKSPYFHHIQTFVDGMEYLCDSCTEFEYEEEIEEEHKFRGTITYKIKKKLKIWGSPWTAAFPGINPKCMAFTMPFGCDNEDHLSEYWDMIPNDTDILITHCPPYGILDGVDSNYDGTLLHTGSISLRNVSMAIKPKLHVFSHIHEWGGKVLDLPLTKYVNCSIMNERYQPVNKPVRIQL